MSGARRKRTPDIRHPMNWKQQNVRLNSALVDARSFGQDATYSRPEGSVLSAIPEFQIRCYVESGGEYADPKGPIEAEMFLSFSSIPFGPQKGDIVVFPSDGNMRDGRHLVQEVFPQKETDSAHLKIRWIGP